ncbi:MAG: PEP-CTERM sorting domain-containing protein [Verrucomicrobiales bacterium]|nr:PEP-CTERM sorting domain-containing protein [Verrucomicrobiales bacterium]
MQFVFLSTLITLSFVSSVGALERSEVAVSPNEELRTRHGNDDGTVFVPDGFTGRVQQIYDASYFSFLPKGGVWIDEIAFRADERFGRNTSYNGTGIQIELSITSVAVDSLSSSFELNVGRDRTIGVDKTDKVSFYTSRPSGQEPGSFGTSLTFYARPFFYDPSKGNLLVDITCFQGIQTSSMDAENVLGDSVATVSGFSETGEIPTSGVVSTKGFVTLFHYHSIPEPSSVPLFLLASGSLAWLFRRSKRNQEHTKNVSA